MSPREGQSSLIVSTFRKIFGLTKATFFFGVVMLLFLPLSLFVCVTILSSLLSAYRLLDHMIITWLLNNYFAPFSAIIFLSP